MIVVEIIPENLQVLEVFRQVTLIRMAGVPVPHPKMFVCLRRERLSSPQDRQQLLWICVVAECTVKVNQEVAIAGTEHKTGAELERILPEPVLPIAGCPRPGSRL